MAVPLNILLYTGHIPLTVLSSSEVVMEDIAYEERQLMDVIPLHFDVKKHYLPLDEFILVAQNARRIVDNFNREFFEGELHYKFVVLPPEKGSFLETLGILALGKMGWDFLNSDIGKKYILGLTGKELDYWSLKAGEATRDLVISNAGNAVQLRKKAAIILSECTKGFFQKEESILKKIGISKRIFRDAYEARNEFYETCSKDPEIKGIGFEKKESFPIQRADFPKFIVDLPPKEEEPQDDWKVVEEDMKVVSPNWGRDGRLWQAKISDHSTVLFSIEDEAFWKMVQAANLKPKIFDNLRVQSAYREIGARRKETRVLRVLSYNGQEISRKLSGITLQKVLGTYSEPEETQELFNLG